MTTYRNPLAHLNEDFSVRKYLRQLSLLSLEAKILRLPRLFKGSDQKKLDSAIVKFIGSLISSVYGIATNKSLNITVKDRRLGTYGRVSVFIGLVISSVGLLLSLHEIWARKRLKPRTHKEFAEQLDRDLADILTNVGSTRRAKATNDKSPVIPFLAEIVKNIFSEANQSDGLNEDIDPDTFRKVANSLGPTQSVYDTRFYRQFVPRLTHRPQDFLDERNREAERRLADRARTALQKDDYTRPSSKETPNLPDEFLS